MSWTNARSLTATKSRKSTPPKRKPTQLGIEKLEAREVFSWSAVPATFSWPSSTNVSFNSNGRSGTATISNNEVDVYNFVAPRSGTYTFNAGKNGSRVDTVAGVFNFSGQRLAGNDDAGGTTDSKFTAYLTAGTRYAFAITNYTGTSTGGYKWSIDGPPLSVSTVSVGSVSTVSTSAFASVRGNTLSVTMYGFNSTNFTSYNHRVDVYLLDANGRAIHSGSWNFSNRTVGTLVPGASTFNRTENFDLSGFDLRNLRNMRVTVSQY